MLKSLDKRATGFRLVMTGFFVLILLHKLSHAYLLSSYQANAKKAIPYGSDFSSHHPRTARNYSRLPRAKAPHENLLAVFGWWDFSLATKLLLCDVFFQVQQSYLDDGHCYEGDCPKID